MNKKPSVTETEQGSCIGREQDILVNRMCMIQERRSGQVQPSQENEQEHSVALENSMSVTGRRKPASRRQGWKDRPGQGLQTASYHVNGLGICSVGEGIFCWGPQPFLIIFTSFSMHSTFICKRHYMLHTTL